MNTFSTNFYCYYLIIQTQSQGTRYCCCCSRSWSLPDTVVCLTLPPFCAMWAYLLFFHMCTRIVIPTIAPASPPAGRTHLVIPTGGTNQPVPPPSTPSCLLDDRVYLSTCPAHARLSPCAHTAATSLLLSRSYLNGSACLGSVACAAN